MKNIIPPSYKHLLYRDEIKDIFILTKYCEIYRKSKFKLGVYWWSYRKFHQVKNMLPNLDFYLTSDNLYCFNIEVAKLNALIQLGAHSRRVFRRGKWLKDKEKRLCLKIFPYNPILDK